MPEAPPGAAAGAGGADRAGGAGDVRGEPNALSSSRYLAWLYSPADLQPVFAALCAIESEVAASLRPGIDHQVAHARLQWWSDEASRLARRQPVHPLTRELVSVYRAGPDRSAAADGGVDISGFVSTAVWDLASATFETRKELTAYCERWASAMFEPVAGASTHWRALGAAVREIELLTHLAPEAHAGRLRVPLDELERAGVDPQALSRPPWPAPLVALLRERHAALRAAVAQAVTSLGREAQARSRGLMVWAALAWRTSLRAQGALPGMIAPRRHHAFADGWQAWRAARRASSGTLRLD